MIWSVLPLHKGDGGGRRTSQLIDLSRKFDGGLEVAKLEQGRDPSCNFSNLAGNSPGPILGRGARRKCIQTNLPYVNRVVRGAAYWSDHRPIGREDW